MTQEQKKRLFDVLYLCQFGRAVALDLCERAALVNQVVSLLTLACVAGALLTGGIAFLETETFKPYWAVPNTLSVVMAIWAAIMSYSEKEFEYHMPASSFQNLALAVENFSGYAAHGNAYAAREIDNKAAGFHAQYSDIMGRTRREYKRYGDRHVARIDKELRERMRAAGFVQDVDETVQDRRAGL